jgi:hypothetical protein
MAEQVVEIDRAMDVWVEENHRLLEVLAALERLGLTPRESEDWRESIADRLDELGTRLGEHFREEEESGLFTSFPERYPRFALRLERLRNEHGEVLSQLHAIEVACDEEIPTAALAARVLALVSTLRRHEAEETEVVHRAACEDIGSVD